MTTWLPSCLRAGVWAALLYHALRCDAVRCDPRRKHSSAVAAHGIEAIRAGLQRQSNTRCRPWNL